MNSFYVKHSESHKLISVYLYVYVEMNKENDPWALNKTSLWIIWIYRLTQSGSWNKTVIETVF